MCIFCDIILKNIPVEVVYESDLVMAFPDKYPVAPVHILIVPKKHVVSMNEFESGDQLLLGEMLLAAKNIAKDLHIAENGYKLVIRTGNHGGQEIPHVHLHLIGGTKLEEGIRPAE